MWDRLQHDIKIKLSLDVLNIIKNNINTVFKNNKADAINITINKSLTYISIISFTKNKEIEENYKVFYEFDNTELLFKTIYEYEDKTAQDFIYRKNIKGIHYTFDIDMLDYFLYTNKDMIITINESNISLNTTNKSLNTAFYIKK